MKSYQGPISDHFDGQHFFDPDGFPLQSFAAILRWRITRKPEIWPKQAPSNFSDTPPPSVHGSKVRLSFVGHASWLLQTAGFNILIDPVWSERCSPFSFLGPKRVNEPGIPFDKLPPIDVILVSHGHYDHLDLRTLSRLASKFSPRVITPLGNDVTMTRFDAAIRAEGYDWGAHVEIGNGVVVHLVPTRHWSARGPFDRNRVLWASFVIETSAGKVYVVCDSGYGDGRHFRLVRDRFGPLRTAILPIGAYEPREFMRDVHMNPADAVKAFEDCGADVALAHHQGTFQLTDEAIDAPAGDLTIALDKAKVSHDKFVVLKPGQVFEIERRYSTHAIDGLNARRPSRVDEGNQQK